jgi:hypothetical protein
MIPGNGSAAGREPFRRAPPDQKQWSWVKGQEMIPLWHIVPAVLAASAAAGCITYFVTPPAQLETEQRLPPTLPNAIGPDTSTSTSIDHLTSEEEKAAAAFQQAAEAILRRAANTRASDEPPITGHIPFPKRRPIPR